MKKRLFASVFLFSVLSLANSLSGAALTAEEALDRALKDTGISADQIRDHKTVTDKDHGTVFYELEFFDESNHYFYAVNGNTGEILKKSVDKMHSHSRTLNSDSLISSSKAEEIALSLSGWSGSDTRTEKLKLDEEDGIMIYEIKIRNGKEKCEIILNALTGDSIEMVKD